MVIQLHPAGPISTDLNVRTLGLSDFGQQISEIIRLVSLPAEVSCSVFLCHVRWDQVFVHTVSNWSPDPLLGLMLQRASIWAELSLKWWKSTHCVCLQRRRGGGQLWDVAPWFGPWKEWRLPEGLLKQWIYSSRPVTGTPSPAVVLTNGLTTQVSCSFFTHSNNQTGWLNIKR